LGLMVIAKSKVIVLLTSQQLEALEVTASRQISCQRCHCSASLLNYGMPVALATIGYRTRYGTVP
jgi:cytochrome c